MSCHFKDHPRTGGFLDRLGMVVTIGCGLHCMALSAVFVLYPALWLNRGLWESGLFRRLYWLELGLLGLTWSLVLAAVAAGWLVHRRLLPALVLGCGLAMITPAMVIVELHFRGGWGSALVLAGAALVVAGHWLNRRMRRRHPA